ncbi:BtrH N-terminal domain-containing protein [Actinoplanes sp. NPDC051859]|uniref:BtrH N-terminal domain-containing protein n=1 Tax=Actinoplanes sp. NPDC051859 TaxID=3363909 RepID=UPI0037BA72AF
MRVEPRPSPYWRHDLTHCLHTAAGALLSAHGLDPLTVLGAGWGFRYVPGEVRREEYYFPGHEDDLFAGLAPYHPVSSRWHQPADAVEGWRQVRAALLRGSPVAVAADNFHLPFRPAYRDVHTNHLLVVDGFDDETGEVFVTDPVPPSFRGPIPLAALTAARDSGNPVAHDRDLFFTANPIGNRWLEATIGPGVPRFDPDFVHHVIAENTRRFTDPAPSGVHSGLAGLHRFLTDAVDRFADDPDAVDELFVVGGPMLAVTGLHAAFLTRAGREFDLPRLCERGREVDRVAHHWSALRIAAATARADRVAAVDGLRRRVSALLDDLERAVGNLRPVPA